MTPLAYREDLRAVLLSQSPLIWLSRLSNEDPDARFGAVRKLFEVGTIPGMGTVRVQFVVSGRGKFTVTVDSPKGGVFESTQELP